MTLARRYEGSDTPLKAGQGPAAAHFPGFRLMPPTLKYMYAFGRHVIWLGSAHVVFDFLQWWRFGLDFLSECG